MDWSAAHAGFVAASYAVSALVLAALLVLVLRRKQQLESALDDAGKSPDDRR